MAAKQEVKGVIISTALLTFIADLALILSGSRHDSLCHINWPYSHVRGMVVGAYEYVCCGVLTSSQLFRVLSRLPLGRAFQLLAAFCRRGYWGPILPRGRTPWGIHTSKHYGKS